MSLFFRCVIFIGFLIAFFYPTIITAQDSDFQWSNSVHSPAINIASDIVVDSEGNSYIVGEFIGETVFGNTTLVSSGSRDIYISKINSDGDFEWTVQAGGAGNDIGFGIDVDTEGNCYVTGQFSGTAEFGDYTLSSGGGFMAKLSSSGIFQWAKEVGDVGRGVVAANGSCYVTGRFKDSATFGDTTLISLGGDDIFVAKMSTEDGEFDWAAHAGGEAALDIAFAIDLDNNGNVFIAGCFGSTGYFGSHSVVSNGSYDIFVAKLDHAGSFLWVSSAGSHSSETAYGIVVDGEGNSYVTGHFHNVVQFGDEILTVSGVFDMFVAKLNPEGEFVWTKRAGGTQNDSGVAIALDFYGNLYLTGWFMGEADFGDFVITSSGLCDVFITRISPHGEFQWAKRAGGDGDDIGVGLGIDVDVERTVYIAGYFEGFILFDEELVADGRDSFVAKLGVQGNFCSIVCSENIVVTIPASQSTTLVTYDVTFDCDNSDGVTLVLVEGLASGSEFPVGETTVTYQLEFDSIVLASCSFTVTVEQENPVCIIECPEDITVTIPASQSTTVVTYDVTFDCNNSDGITLVLIEGFPSGSEFPVGGTEVIYELVFDDTVLESCSFTVTVNQANPECTIECPEDILVSVPEGQTGANLEYEVNFDCDNTDGVSLVLVEGLPSGATFPVGETIVVYNLEFDGEVLDSCTFSVIVEEILSIEDFSHTGFIIYPNPVTDIVSINGTLEITFISIFDISGKEVLAIEVKDEMTLVDVSSLKSGMYFVKVYSKSELLGVKKLIRK